MRLATFGVLTTTALVTFSAFAQQTPGVTGAPPGPPAMVTPPPAPSTVGVAAPADHPPIPAPDPEQEVPLAPVKTAPCSVFARETDGTTTCIGIPRESGHVKRRR